MTGISRKEQAKYEMIIGSRAQVMNGTAHHTSGGLTKNDLFYNKHGRIVSKSKHFSAKKEMRLLKHGFGTKKGKFGFVKLDKSKTKKMRGGMGALTPSDYPSTTGGSRRRRRRGGAPGLTTGDSHPHAAPVGGHVPNKL